MKKGKHTSGPWKVYHQELRKQFPGHKIIEVQDDHGYAVVQWSGFDNSDRLKNVHLANARLIAAAPDLLAALHIAAQYVDNSDSPGGCDGRQKNCAHCDAIRMINKAIAKAYGE